MTTRITQKTVFFKKPFRLSERGELFPAGAYPIEMDEELVQGLSFPVYRRTAMTMHLIADPRQPGVKESTMVDALQLEGALARDLAQSFVAGGDETHGPVAANASDAGVRIVTEREVAPRELKS